MEPSTEVAGERSELRPTKLKIFISYSREDLAFADQLYAALEAMGFAPTLDRVGISGAADWRQTLRNMILECDTVVFVLSPASVASPMCAEEVAEADRFSKRIIPVVCVPLADAAVPRRLQDLNYIYFYPEAKSPGAGFGSGLGRLKIALETDLAWTREHTRLLERSREWEAAGRVDNRLLSGKDITLAKEWIASKPKNAPAPTELHYEFISASEKAEEDRVVAERRRVEELQAALALAETAKQAAEASRRAVEDARAREATAARRVVHRTTAGLAVALVLAAGAGGTGYVAYLNQLEARRQEAAARTAEADAQRQATLAREAQVLAQQQADLAQAAEVRARDEAAKAVAARADAESKGDEIGTLIKAVATELDRPWPLDLLSPDYRHLASTRLGKSLAGSEFTLTPDGLDLLIAANAFEPRPLDNKVIVTLRGAQLVQSANTVNSDRIRVRDVRPDHRSLRSLVIVFDRAARRLSAFPGASVPSTNLMQMAAAKGGQGANLMSTGSYRYVIGTINLASGPRPGNLIQNETIVVRRTTEKSYQIVDQVSLGNPRNNIHASYSSQSADFISAGSITIQGRQNSTTPFEFSGPIADFRKAVGLSSEAGFTRDRGKEIGVVILTGLDAAIASTLASRAQAPTAEEKSLYLTRLRFGSTGEAVARLQKVLGLQPDGYVGPTTVDALARLQNARLGWWDAILTPEVDARLGLCVMEPGNCTPQSAPAPKNEPADTDRKQR